VYASVIYDHLWSGYGLDLLTSKCNQFISVPNCTTYVNLVKFSKVVCTICSQTSRTLAWTKGCKVYLNIQCLQHLMVAET